MSEPVTVISRPSPNDGFTHSVARWIREQAQSTYRSNPDAWGSQRHLAACEHLATYITTLPLWDPRFRLLLRVSSDSDYFTPAGNAQKFVTFLGLDVPAPPDVSAQFTEFVIEAAASLTPRPTQEEVNEIRAEINASRSEDAGHITALQQEIALRDREISKRDQELSDLRGRLKRSDAADVEKLEEQVAQLRREVDASPKKSKPKKVAA